ncbi:putative protein tag-76, partial [Trichinella britovi]
LWMVFRISGMFRLRMTGNNLESPVSGISHVRHTVPSCRTILPRWLHRLFIQRLPSGASCGHVSFSIHSRTCMHSASSFCQRSTRLAESNAIAATWTSEESSPDPHCLQARRDNASAFWCFFSGRWTTSKSKSFKAVRNSFYCIPHGTGADMKYGIELWRGLFISARVIDGFRPAINIHVSYSCFYKRQSLINLFCNILNGDEREVKFHPNQLRLNTRLQPEQLSLLIPELKELSILMKFTGLVHLDFRNAEAGSLDEREKGPIQFLDILFAQGRSSPLFELSKSFKAVRNSFYCIPHGAGADMKYGIELWRGLFISARVIDVSHSCFYKRQSLINLICDILNGDEREVKFHPNQLRLNTRLQPEQLNLLIPELKGVNIHTTHRNQDRIYRIKDILSTAVSMKFKRDGNEVSVAEYFHDVYGPLKYPNLPLVQVSSKSKAIYVPVELCQVANCQRYNKKLKACQTTSIIRFASTDAPTRNLKCIDIFKKSNFNSDPFLKSFGVQIKAEPMIVDGRVLPPPRLEYGKGNGGRQIILTPKDGAWNFLNLLLVNHLNLYRFYHHIKHQCYRN